MREIKLPSGARLKVAAAPFADAKRLWQAVTREMRSIRVSMKDDVGNMMKDVFCAGYSSEEIDECLKPCMERCLYVGPKKGDAEMKIDADTFDPVERRQDYLTVCMEVARENVGPFVKSLFAEWQQATAKIGNSPTSKQQTTTS